MTTSLDISFGTFLTNTFGDQYLYEVNHTVFNQVGAKTYLTQHFGESFSQTNHLFIIIGTDSGLLLSYLLKTGLSSGSRALFIEFPEVINCISSRIDLSSLPDNIKVLPFEEWEQALKASNLETYVYLDGVVLLASIGAADGHIPEYHEIQCFLRQKIEEQVWHIKAEIGTAFFVVRQLENLADTRWPAIHLKGLFKGKTAVILGGGPSLDEAIPWVQEHQNEIFIFAVSRISRRLLEVGLKPHLVVTIDPLDVSYEVGKEMLQLDPETVLVSAHHACPQLVGQWQGRGLYLGDRYPWRTKWNLENFDVCGPTVTNAALGTARQMGFSQILLAGFDLCFTKEGFSHAQGSKEREAGPQLAEIMPRVETNGGEIVDTTRAYLLAMTDLALQAGEALAAGCTVINVAATAAKIDNVQYSSLDQVAIEPCETRPQEALSQVLPEDSLESRKLDLSQVTTELKRVRTQLKKMEHLAAEALECNDGLFGRNGKKADFKYKIRMDKIEKRLNREFSDLVVLVKQYGLSWFLKTTRTDAHAEWTDAEIENTGRIYYETYVASCCELGDLLESALYRLKLRAMELSHSADIQQLVTHWSAENLPGRAQIFLNLPVERDLSESELEQLQKVRQGFWSEVRNHKPWGKTVYFNLLSIKSKALLYFQQNSVAELENLLAVIEGHYADADGAQLLQKILEAYLAELRNDSETALIAYQSVITEEIHFLTEEALKRVAGLSIEIEDMENALLALECLTQISPAYQPNYATLLGLLKRYDEAAEVYGDYLTKVPNDAMTMLKLGQLYLEMNAANAARMAFGYVLEMDPENSSAQTLLEQLGDNNG